MPRITSVSIKPLRTARMCVACKYCVITDLSNMVGYCDFPNAALNNLRIDLDSIHNCKKYEIRNIPEAPLIEEELSRIMQEKPDLVLNGTVTLNHLKARHRNTKK